MWEHWVSCLQQNGWRLILCRKASLPASLAYMSQDRHRRAKLSSSALERVLKQPKIHNSKLLRNFLHTFVCVHICMRRFVHVICFWLSVLPVGCCPSLLLELGNYYVVRMGWRWKLFYSENPLYQIQHFSTRFPGHVFFLSPVRAYHHLCRYFWTSSVTTFCFVLHFARLYLLSDQLSSSFFPSH